MILFFYEKNLLIIYNSKFKKSVVIGNLLTMIPNSFWLLSLLINLWYAVFALGLTTL